MLASSHSFHIPVMGTGFTIDTPLKVARYGISSVVSLVDDTLIEQMRAHHCRRLELPYEEIHRHSEDCRARRITAYLDLLDDLIARQVAELQASPFAPGSEITRYFELLPEGRLRRLYQKMLSLPAGPARERLEAKLRRRAVPGSLDVNIMTKLDRELHRGDETLPPEFSDACAALRGFVRSTATGAMVFSAGLNQRLYAYAAEFPEFLPDAAGRLRKRIVLKVADLRSATIQGKFLAKRGLWVSEFRIESGLNCGGHAFGGEGRLLGPILEEFRAGRAELHQTLAGIYRKALDARGLTGPVPARARLTAQGGIGTAEEDQFLRRYYELDGTGWGTPFMLVPEAVNMDPVSLELLQDKERGEVFLGGSSPLGVPFWNMVYSASEVSRRQRVAEGKGGTACPKGHLALNREFGEALCAASRRFVKRKLAKLAETSDLTEIQREFLRREIIGKSCICNDLAGAATLGLGIDPHATPALCCGPNIRFFSAKATLEEMAGHIYGRLSLLAEEAKRPHLFINEARVCLDFARQELDRFALGLSSHSRDYFDKFKDNLLEGLNYYGELAREFSEKSKAGFLRDLKELREEIATRLALPAELPLDPARVSPA